MAAITDPAAQVYARLRIRAALWGLSKTAFLTGIFCVSVVAQTTKLSFTHLSVADGLSHADVRAIAQDRQGFMWFGTWLGGLNRYDGYTFRVYKHDDQDQRSLINDTVRTLYVDHTGVLWISTWGPGLDRYDRDTDSFTHFRHDPHDPTSLPDNNVKAFYEDETGTLWVGTHAGLSRFDRARGTFFTYRARPDDPASFGETHVQSIGLDATTGMLWVGTEDSGVKVLDRSTGHFTSYANDPDDASSLSNNVVLNIFQDRAGARWLSTADGLNRFDPRTHKFVRYFHDLRNPSSLSDNSVLETYDDRAGRFWVVTNNGLNLMDRARGTFARYLHDRNDPSSLSGNTFNYEALCEDTSGTLWMGMRSTGVDRLASAAARFTTYRHNSQDVNSLDNDSVTSLALGSGGELWIGTETGLNRFDGRTFTHYVNDPHDPSSLSPGPQRMVAQDSHGVVWTGTYGGGLDRLDGQRVKHFRHDPRNSDSPANDNISNLAPDAQGGLWIGVHGKGMDYFDGRRFTHFAPDPANPTSLPDAYALPLLLDRHGMLWIGTTNSGLVRFDTHTRKFTTYLIDPNQPGSQAANWTKDVYSDGASIWVASSIGLSRFDPETGKFTHHYTEKDGLANNSVVGVLGDAQGNVWVSTIKGLSRFDPRTETFRNYDVFDGLQGNEFSLHCRAKAPDGRLFFAGVNGLSAFYPDKLVDNTTPPPVVLTEFELFNKPVKIGAKDSPLRQAINVATSITLRYEQAVFRFQFAALNYSAPQKNRYAYKLDGFDRDWQYTDATRRFATYTNLDHGDYTFRVKASNNDGVWNEQGVALHIRILPPWWSTWWFRALVLASILLSIWCAYQLRVRELRREFHARIEERARIARELHDGLLQSFQGLMFSFQAARNLLPGRTDEAIRTLDKAIVKGDDAIAEGRDAIQGLRANPALESNLEHLLTAAGKELSRSSSAEGEPPAFQVTVEGSPQPLSPLLQDEVYRIAREILRNAFHHAHASRIEAEVAYDSQFFRLRIRDNGKGINPKILDQGARQGHWGLPGVRERAKRIGARLKLWSETGAGTELEFTVPARIAYGTVRRRQGLGFFRRNKMQL